MNISLTPELERFIQEKVASGMYTSASEVIRESLRLMHAYDDVQKQRIVDFRRAIDIGMEQLHQEQVVDGLASRENMKHRIDAIIKGKE